LSILIPKMLITLNINDDSSITIPVDKLSPLLLSSIVNSDTLTIDDNNNTANLQVPDKYLPMFQHYNNYLLCEDVIINDVDELSLCIELATYYEDQQFLSLLMTKVYNIWNEFYPRIPYDREVFLRVPFEFVPDWLMDQKPFFKQWLKINENKTITLNGNETYHTIVEYYGPENLHNHDCKPNCECKTWVYKLEAYHTINGRKVGYGVAKQWYENGQLIRQYQYDSYVKDGLQQWWHDNGTIRGVYGYKDRKKHGLHAEYHECGTAIFKEMYDMGSCVWNQW